MVRGGRGALPSLYIVHNEMFPFMFLIKTPFPSKYREMGNGKWEISVLSFVERPIFRYVALIGQENDSSK